MKQFESPAAIDFPQLPLHATVIRLSLAIAVVGIAAATWMSTGALAGRNQQAAGPTAAAEPAILVRVSLPPVVVIGHRESLDDRANTTTLADIAAGVAQGSGLDPAVPAANRVNLKQ